MDGSWHSSGPLLHSRPGFASSSDGIGNCPRTSRARRNRRRSVPRVGIGNPRADLAIEDVERHRALAEHDVVELAHVEPVPSCCSARVRSSRIFSSPIL